MHNVTTGPAAQSQVFRGWWVVLGAFGVTGMGFGCAYTFSVFVEPLQQVFGASRGQAALVFSIAACLNFALGVVSGPLADRYGARRLALAGTVLVGAGLLLAGQARTLMQVYLAYGAGVGIGVGLAYVPAIAAVQRWFTRRRGFASGLAVSGIGAGTLLMPPLAGWLVDAQGWRMAYTALGIAALVLGGSAALLIESDPAARGLGPDGDPPAPRAAAASAPGYTVREALRSRAFWLLYVSGALVSFAAFVPFAHLVPYAVDHGIPKPQAVLLLGAIGIGSTLGRFAIGGVVDRIGRSRALAGIYLLMGLCMGVWALATSWGALAVFALAYGAIYGGWSAVIPAVTMDQFGGRQLSSIIGVLYTSVAVGTLVGPTLAGFAYDLLNSYLLPIGAGALLNVLAACVLLRLPRPGVPAAA
ncbi:MAG: MFS transporter [Proteobacteria bacterium]|nr:MFS transporter [Pseudomonadota bacterium]